MFHYLRDGLAYLKRQNKLKRLEKNKRSSLFLRRGIDEEKGEDIGTNSAAARAAAISSSSSM